MKERSYVMIKPEFANYSSVISEVEKRLTNAGLKIVICEVLDDIGFSALTYTKHQKRFSARRVLPFLQFFCDPSEHYLILLVF